MEVVMTKRLVLGFAAALALLLALPEDADAQYFTPQRPRMGARHRPHLYVGGQLMGFAVANQAGTEYLGPGGGGGLFGGFRFSPYFGIEGNWTVTYHDEQFADGTTIDIDAFYVMTFTADAKIFIPTFGPLEPYFQAGVGFAYTGATYGSGYYGDEASIWASGPTFNVGGGVDFYVGPNISIGARLLYRGFYFTPTDFPNADPNYISGISLDANATFHF